MKCADLKVSDGVVTSGNYGDVYFDTKNGLDETKHVFIDRNGIPGILKGIDSFTIVETGFGTGMNFLVFLNEYEKEGLTTPVNYYSVERYPIEKNSLEKIFERWTDLNFKESLITNYPYTEGMHRIEFKKGVTLNLFIGDLVDFLPLLQIKVDCWFLDGFSPDKNPDMWSNDLFKKMGEITKTKGTFASYTAAGIVKRGLRSNGFFVKRYPGFGRKRHMIAGYRE